MSVGEKGHIHIGKADAQPVRIFCKLSGGTGIQKILFPFILNMYCQPVLSAQRVRSLIFNESRDFPVIFLLKWWLIV